MRPGNHVGPEPGAATAARNLALRPRRAVSFENGWWPVLSGHCRQKIRSVKSSAITLPGSLRHTAGVSGRIEVKRAIERVNGHQLFRSTAQQADPPWSGRVRSRICVLKIYRGRFGGAPRRRSLPVIRDAEPPENLRSSGLARPPPRSSPKLTFSRSLLVRNRLTRGPSTRSPERAVCENHSCCSRRRSGTKKQKRWTPRRGLAPCRDRRSKRVALRGARWGNPLRVPSLHRADQAVFHHAGLRKRKTARMS